MFLQFFSLQKINTLISLIAILINIISYISGNRPHPSSPSPLFGESDPRLLYSVKNIDPRIHFALVCGAKVCLVIRGYQDHSI